MRWASCYSGEGKIKLGVKPSNHNCTESLGKLPFNFSSALYTDGRGENYWKVGMSCLTPALIHACAQGLAVGLPRGWYNTCSASFLGAALEPPVQTPYLSHLVCKPKSSAVVTNGHHCCMGTASLYIIIRVTYLHVQKTILKSFLALAVNNVTCRLLTNKPWPLNLLGSSVISHTVVILSFEMVWQ